MKRILKILSLILISIVIFHLAMVPMSFTQDKAGNGNTGILVVAHRGASGLAPENTLPAIESAMNARADYIEIDVQLSKDKAVIVMHDESVDRTTDGKGKIEEMSSDEIKALDAGSWFGEKFAGTEVPLLEEVIQLVNGQTKLLIEIKKKGRENEGLEQKVIEIIRKYHGEAWCEVQSFNDGVLELIHREAPEIILHKLIVFKYRLIPYAFDGRITRFSMDKYHYVHNVNMHYRFFNKTLSQKIRGSEKKILLWGCREENPCFPLEMRGYDGIITDYPAHIQTLIDCP
jgi:glycerophosphoryl diester phosphodiesterase